MDLNNEFNNEFEVIVFQTEDGEEIDMLIIDEFDYEGKNYIALIESLVGENVVSESYDFDETIMFCEVILESAEETIVPIQSNSLIAKLEDVLEKRLLERDKNWLTIENKATIY